MSWLLDRWALMSRTKPQHSSVLGRRRSDGAPRMSPRTQMLGCAVGVSVACCGVTVGVLLVLFQQRTLGMAGPDLMVAVVVAGLASFLGGLCLSEYLSIQPLEVPSLYTCCYQNSSEAFAFLVGWTWLLSQSATVAAICKTFAAHTDRWTEHALQKLLGSDAFPLAAEVPAVFFALCFVLVVLTGVNETSFWFVLSTPVVFVLVTVASILTLVVSGIQWPAFTSGQWHQMEGLKKILTSSAICTVFFSGAQSLLRIPPSKMPQKTTAVLAPLNSIALVITLAFVAIVDPVPTNSSDPSTTLAINVLLALCLCAIGIEMIYPMHFVAEDMANDGLLFRSFAKKWKPFCFPVASPFVHVLTVIIVSLLAVFLPLAKDLYLAVLFPLFINSVVPVMVLLQRYRDKGSWQYEPMFHTATQSTPHHRSRSKSEESQYTNNLGFDITDPMETSTACIDESEGSSETDVDAVVQQYKENVRITSSSTLDDPIPENSDREPTPSSSLRAKFCIACMSAISLAIAVILNVANLADDVAPLVVVLFCLVLFTFLQALLLCLPQNARHGDGLGLCHRVIPRMPWLPAFGSLLSLNLFVHCLLDIWQVFVTWLVIGLLIYFAYGMRSSTAASSFYNMKPALIALRPLPSYGNNCVTQVIPSQRKSKSRKKRNLKNGLI